MNKGGIFNVYSSYPSNFFDVSSNDHVIQKQNTQGMNMTII